MNRFLALALVSGLGWGVVGCQGPALTAVPAAPAAPSHYGIAPGDLLAVSFVGEPELSQQARVDWNGMIRLPALSQEGDFQLKAAGMSPASLASAIGRQAVANKLLIKAQAQVLVTEYAPQAFSVLGQVAQPGRYSFPRGLPPRLSLEEAVAMAGGYTRLAQQSKVLLKRGNQVFCVDLARLASQSGEAAVVVVPGDVITVRERLF
jgi:protein involved in polysaccharide export with SLBB domain